MARLDAFQDFTFAQFLTNQATNYKRTLPLVHSSESHRMLKMLGDGKVAVTECDTFKGENLAYFFYGRPSYRKFYERPKEWQLPFVMVLKSTCLLSLKRLFPFDSGAFFSNRLPSYMTSFPAEDFELSSNPAAIDLLIDIFFGSDEDYLHNRSKPAAEVTHRRKLGVRHPEVKALCAMYNGDEVKADDRSRAFELQTDTDVKIKDELLAVVMPRPYFDDKKLKAALKSQGVIARPYDVWELNTEGYMSAIYTEVKAVYKKLGFLDA